uniref:Uncharacterized protein n=1 Tax=Alexandrium catenella TaxID=2925 RepID=A0A7S1RUI8_ALECA|mmetsp:Transcript_72971/g.193847  ORF Transcript_72971/g.193847 Transcript_72971/m.193847 type:complete len:281 (+) Transcript_72971:58-900(+)
MAPRFLHSALAVATGSVMALSATMSEDAAALLQVSAISVNETSLKSAADPCRCLKWTDVYEDYGVLCGMGSEFSFLPVHQQRPNLKKQMCEHFFTQFGTNYCVQEWFMSRERTQWCYVSAECENLDGGSYLAGTAAAWKVCDGAKGDTLLNTKGPHELFALGIDFKMDPGYMLRMAYPVWGTTVESLHWVGVQQALGLQPPTGNVTAKSEWLETIKDERLPWIVDSHDGLNPFGLVIGSMILEAKYSDWFYENVHNLTHVLENEWRSTELECVSGCTSWH